MAGLPGNVPAITAPAGVAGATPVLASGRTVTLPDLPYRRLAGFALVGVAGLIAAFLAYLFLFTPLTASRSQAKLVASLKGHPLNVYQLVGGHAPAEGSAVAVLQIPALGLDKVVVQGTSAADLMGGPGLMPGTALPGTVGNAVVAARRVTFGGPFGSIGSLRAGQAIRVVDGVGTFTYKVVGSRTVGIGQRDVVVPTADNRLTLIASDSSLVAGGREVVVAKLVGRAIAVPGESAAVPGYDLALGGDAAAGGLVLLWSILTVVLLVAAAYLAWRTRRGWLVYFFTAPVVVLCGLFACQSLARALPATY